MTLQAKRDKARPGDQHLFLAEPDKFVKEASIAKISGYIATASSAISNSVKQAKKYAIVGTTSMLQFFQPIREHGLANIMRIARERHQHDSFAKKKRNKDEDSKLCQQQLNVEVRRTPASRRLPRNTSQKNIAKTQQPPITNFLSLRQIC